MRREGGGEGDGEEGGKGEEEGEGYVPSTLSHSGASPLIRRSRARQEGCEQRKEQTGHPRERSATTCYDCHPLNVEIPRRMKDGR